MLLPVRLQIPYVYAPISNIIIIAITCITYLAGAFNILPASVMQSMTLQDWSIDGLLGSLFLHGEIFHLLANMVFLWVFGNAINSIVGNLWYLPSYLFLGLCSGSVHLLMNGIPAAGASGAVNGIIGMSLVLFPLNKLEFTFYSDVSGTKEFSIQCYRVIPVWILGDLFGAYMGGAEITYWAHLGGFFSGMVLATIFLLSSKIALYDPTLFDIIQHPEHKLKEKVTINSKNYVFNIKNRIKNLEKESIVSEDPFSMGQSISKDDDPFGMAGFTQSVPVQESPPAPESVTIPHPSPTSVGDTISPDSIGETVLKEEIKIPVISLRLLRIIRDDSQWTCFFVNEGDELENLAVEHPDAVNAEIYPNKTLKKKEPGWIKLSFKEGAVPPEVGFLLKCHGGSEGFIQTRFMIDEESKKIKT